MIYLHKHKRYEEWTAGFEYHLSKNRIKFTKCNICDFDFSKVKKQDFLIGRYNEHCEEIIKNYFNICKLFNFNTYPNYSSIYFYNDKIKQNKLFKNNNYPTPKTFILLNDKDKNNLKLRFPMVLKKSHGSSSKNVKLITNINQIEIPCVLQEYCYCEYDLRLNVIGNKIFGFKRLNRKNDFRASGSGLIERIEEFPEECLDISYQICKNHNFHMMCFDFIYYEKKWLLIEMSYTFRKDAIEKNCDFYIKMPEKNKIKCKIDPAELIIQDVFTIKFL